LAKSNNKGRAYYLSRAWSLFSDDFYSLAMVIPIVSASSEDVIGFYSYLIRQFSYAKAYLHRGLLHLKNQDKELAILDFKKFLQRMDSYDLPDALENAVTILQH